jgi:hypothetical protein
VVARGDFHLRLGEGYGCEAGIADDEVIWPILRVVVGDVRGPARLSGGCFA